MSPRKPESRFRQSPCTCETLPASLRTPVGALPPRKLGELVAQAREYSFDFLAWKRAFVLRQHWQVHAKSICPRDGNLLSYRKKLGRTQRRAFYCELCQRLYR